MKLPIFAVIVITLTASTVFADIPDEFTNLEVLPKDTGKQELIEIMKSFSMALGMRCTGCHEIKTPGDYSSIDWASDAVEEKKVARGMMNMTHQINDDLLPKATGEDDFQIKCVTCHRGVKHPRMLEEVLLRTIDKDGLEAGEERYRQLREKYYGSGSYDFTPGTLSTVAEALAGEKSDVAGARHMLALNIEMNPDDANSYIMLANLDISAGDEAGARSNLEKALEIAPDHEWAKELLEGLGK